MPGPLLGPESSKKLILGSELRYLVPLSEDGRIRDLGFAPHLEFGLLAESLAFDLPICFVADDQDGLIGGLRFGNLTENDEFMFGIFVGKSFSFFAVNRGNARPGVSDQRAAWCQAAFTITAHGAQVHSPR